MMDLEGSSFCPDPATGVDLLPLIVTAASPSETRRWQVLMASTGMWVCRPGEEVQSHEVPTIHVHVEEDMAWLTWVRPTRDLRALSDQLKRWWWETQEQVELNGNRPDDVSRFELHQRMLSGLYSRGFETGGVFGNLRWLEFRDRDWRIIADSSALIVRRVSSGEGLD